MSLGWFDHNLQEIRSNDKSAELAALLLAELSHNSKEYRELTRGISLLISNGFSVQTLVAATQMINADHTLRNALAVYASPEDRRALLVKSEDAVQLAASVATEPGMSSAISQRAFTVLLLGTQDEHLSNRSLIEAEGGAPIRVDLHAELAKIPLEDVVMVVVAPSWWRSAPQQDVAAALRTVCRLSSFSWTLVTAEGLSPELIASCGQSGNEFTACRRSASFALHQSHEATTEEIRKARIAYEQTTIEGIPMVFENVSLRELAIVRRAILDQAMQLPTKVQLRRIVYDVTKVGASNAKKLMLKPDGIGAAYFAKISDKESAFREWNRVNAALVSWDIAALPELYFEGESGVLLYKLQEDKLGTGHPAPTLWQLFRDAYYADSWEGQESQALELLQRIVRCIGSTCEKLQSLSGHVEGERSYDLDWIPRTIRKLLGSGFSFGIAGLSDDKIVERCEEACRICKDSGAVGLLHGDMHLEQVVIVGDCSAQLIDLEYCGQGNPFYDVARLEAAALLGWMRAPADPAAIQGKLRELRSGKEPDDLSVLTVERAALQVSRQCYLLARTLCDRYSVSITEYHEMRILVACASCNVEKMQAHAAIGMLLDALWPG